MQVNSSQVYIITFVKEVNKIFFHHFTSVACLLLMNYTHSAQADAGLCIEIQAKRNIYHIIVFCLFLYSLKETHLCLRGPQDYCISKLRTDTSNWEASQCGVRNVQESGKRIFSFCNTLNSLTDDEYVYLHIHSCRIYIYSSLQGCWPLSYCAYCTNNCVMF